MTYNTILLLHVRSSSTTRRKQTNECQEQEEIHLKVNEIQELELDYRSKRMHSLTCSLSVRYEVYVMTFQCSIHTVASLGVLLHSTGNPLCVGCPANLWSTRCSAQWNLRTSATCSSFTWATSLLTAKGVREHAENARLVTRFV